MVLYVICLKKKKDKIKNQGTGTFKKRKKKEPNVNSRLKDYNWIEIKILIDGLNSRWVVVIIWK